MKKQIIIGVLLLASVVAAGFSLAFVTGPYSVSNIEMDTWSGSVDDASTSNRFWIGATGAIVTTAKSVNTPPVGAIVAVDLMEGNSTTWNAHIDTNSSVGVGTCCYVFVNIDDASVQLPVTGGNVTLAGGVTGNKSVYFFVEKIDSTDCVCNGNVTVSP